MTVSNLNKNAHGERCKGKTKGSAQPQIHQKNDPTARKISLLCSPMQQTPTFPATPRRAIEEQQTPGGESSIDAQIAAKHQKCNAPNPQSHERSKEKPRRCRTRGNHSH